MKLKVIKTREKTNNNGNNNNGNTDARGTSGR